MSEGKELRLWSDSFMFEAEAIDPSDGPQVWLLSCNPDPLGSIAAAAKAYKGEFVTSLAEVTDEERKHYLAEIQKTALAMPLEAVHFHFRIAGVTRGFTHQMVRQRTAAYSQESTRFAVKSGVPVGLPPSLVGTVSRDEWIDQEFEKHGVPGNVLAIETDSYWDSEIERYATEQQKWRFEWDDAVEHIEQAYNQMVNSGMPAEDARGLLPTNLLTQLNYFTNLRNYKDEAGKRLCTQAQFEWRIVFSKMVEAIREYGRTQQYERPAERDDEIIDINPDGVARASSAWQFDAIADLFRPVCYYKGSCQFNADFDRKCSIKERVQQNAAVNRPSTEWAEASGWVDYDGKGDKIILPIHPAEWLMDPGAAR